jgi:hypothetical protein
MRQISRLPTLTQQELNAAWAALAQGDPGGMSAVVFDRADVALIGAYMMSFGTRNPFWQMIVSGERQAFGVALHEAVEIRTLQQCGVDFVDPVARRPRYLRAHVEALLAELGYWQDWAQAAGYPTMLRALLVEMPWRQPFHPWNEAALVDLYRPNVLGSASVSERRAAADFFKKVVLQQP